jgi:ABC-type transport system involved in cytochrome c biogenesis permease component
MFKIFCTPLLFAGTLKQRLRLSLDHNPIGWLQQRRWSARLSQWGWIAIMLVAATRAVVGNWHSLPAHLLFLALLLGVNICLSAAGSFRNEKQSGALELLMVTPLSGRAILTGRLRGIWQQFALPIALWIVLWLYLTSAQIPYIRSITAMHSFLALLLVLLGAWRLPLIGIQQSFARKTLAGAWLMSMLYGLVIPGIAAFLVLWVSRPFRFSPNAYPSEAASLGLLVFGLVLWRMGRQSMQSVVDTLERREFVLEQ